MSDGPDTTDEAAEGADTGVVSELAKELAELTSKSYRIEVDTAYAIISELWQKEKSLWDQAETVTDAQRLKRTRAYKQAADRARTEIYYRLRRYRQDDSRLSEATDELRELAAAGGSSRDPSAHAARDVIVAAHVSTRERLEHLEQFFEALFALVPEPSSVLDLGCGVQPLLYPFDAAGRKTTKYLGLDRDAIALAAVNAWGALLSGARLEARRWSLSDGFSGVTGPEPGGAFDLALGLKLVPVLARQESESLAILRQVPARRFLVTGSRQAMVKRRSIEWREERSLRSFAAEQDFSVASTFQTHTEIGLLLEKRGCP